MKNNKQEILERVLLLMKYDNKETLSENYNKVISEQPNPNIQLPTQNSTPRPSFLPKDSGGPPPPLMSNNIEEIAKWIDDNSFFKTKEWESYLNTYIDIISHMSLDELLKLQATMSNRTGAITDGLPGFKPYEDILYASGSKPPKRYGYTLTSLILENEIASKRELIGQRASKPNVTLVTDSNLKPYKYKSASQLYNERTNTKKNTGNTNNIIPINNTNNIIDRYNKTANAKNDPNSGINKFRKWFINNFPDKAKNICGDGESLESTGGYTKWYKCAQNFKPWDGKYTFLRSEWKKQAEFNKALVPQQRNPKILEPEMYDNLTAGDFYFNFQPKNHPLKGKIYATEITRLESKNDMWVKEFPNVKILDKNDWKWIESQMKTSYGIENGYPPIVKQAIENKMKKMQNAFYESIAENGFVNNIYSSAEAKCLVGLYKGKVCRDLKIKYCGKAAKEYLEKMARGEAINCKGQIVGRYYGNEGISLEIARECKGFEIPCTTEFWEEYGTKIQIGGAIASFLVGLINPLAGVILDTLINGYALKQSIQEKDNVGIAFNSLFLLLPPAFELGAFDGLVAKKIFSKNTISQVSDKFKTYMTNFPNATEQEIRNFITSLSPEGQEVFKYIVKNGSSDPLITNGFKKAADNMFGAATKKVDKISNILTLTTYGTAGLSYYFTNKLLASKLEELRKKGQISLQAVKAWDMIDAQMTSSENTELTKVLSDPKFIKDAMSRPEFQKLSQAIADSEGLTSDVLNNKIPEIRKKVNDALRSTLEELRKEKNNVIQSSLTQSQKDKIEVYDDLGYIKISNDEYNKEPEKYTYVSVDNLWYGKKVK